jgi:hypothetical protein
MQLTLKSSRASLGEQPEQPELQAPRQPVQPPLATTLLSLSLTPSNQKWFYSVNSQFTKSKNQKIKK